MPFTAPVLDIGAGLAQGIADGGKALGSAIDKIGETYAQTKAAEGTAQFLAKAGAMSNEELSEFMGMNKNAKMQTIGMLMSKYMLGNQMQQQMALQKNQGQVEAGTHAANTTSDYSIAAQHGLVPGVQNSKLPANPLNGAPPAPGTPPVPTGAPAPWAKGSQKIDISGKSYYQLPNGQIFDPQTNQYYTIDQLKSMLK